MLHVSDRYLPIQSFASMLIYWNQTVTPKWSSVWTLISCNLIAIWTFSHFPECYSIEMRFLFQNSIVFIDVNLLKSLPLLQNLVSCLNVNLLKSDLYFKVQSFSWISFKSDFYSIEIKLLLKNQDIQSDL